MAASDSKAPVRQVKRVQFGILAPDEIVSCTSTLSDIFIFVFKTIFCTPCPTFTFKLKIICLAIQMCLRCVPAICESFRKLNL